MKVLGSQEKILTLYINAFKKNVLGFIFEISTFKVLFQNAFFKNTFISEKHVVPTKMVWLKGRSF